MRRIHRIPQPGGRILRRHIVDPHTGPGFGPGEVLQLPGRTLDGEDLRGQVPRVAIGCGGGPGRRLLPSGDVGRLTVEDAVERTQHRDVLHREVVAFGVGLAVIRFLMAYISKRSFLPFVVYRVVLGAALLIALAAGWIAA